MSNGSGIVLKQAAATDIPTPDVGKDTLFMNTATGAPAYKDSTGTVYALTGPQGPTGAQGPTGPPGSAVDGEDGEALILAMPGPQGVTGPTGSAGSAGATGPPGAPGNPVWLEDGLDGEQGFPGVITQGGTSGFSGWQLVATLLPSGNASVNLTNLGQYNDFLLLFVGITFGSTADAEVRFSVDNGSTFDNTSGHYIGVNGAGVESNKTALLVWGANNTTARTGFLQIQGLRIAAPKQVHGNFFSVDSIHFQYINQTVTTINAFMFLNSGAGNYTGGTIYVLGR